MTDALAQIDDRLAAVLFDGRGADLSLGALAARESIAPRTFRRVYQPLDDPRLDGSMFDRGAWLKWTSSDEAPRNVLDPDRVETHALELQIGYIHGAALGSLAHVTPDETQADAVKHSRRRAHADATKIVGALACGDLFQGGMTGVEILSVTRVSLAVDELADGRVLARSTFNVLVAIENT